MNNDTNTINNPFIEECSRTGFSGKNRGNYRLSKIKTLFAGTSTAIFIDDRRMTVTVIKANKVTKFISEPLPSGMVSNGEVVTPELLAKKIREVIKTNKFKLGKVFLGLSGLRAITRTITLPAIPKKLIPESIIHEAERELPISVDSVYLSWYILEQSLIETRIFLIAYDRNVIDSLVKTFAIARIGNYVMQLAPLSLPRLVNTPTAAIFNLRPGEIDIMITSYSAPVLVRSVPLPRDTSIEDNLPIIREELERTIVFYEPEKPVGDVPVFGYGGLSNAARDYLSNSLNLTISSPLPEFLCPEGFSPAANAVSIALLMPEQKQTPDTPKVASLDLMPAIYRKPLLPDVMIISGAVCVLALLLFSVAQYALAAERTNSYRDQLSAAQKTFTERQAQIAAQKKVVSAFDAQVSKASLTFNTFNNSMAVLNAQRTNIDNDLQGALKSMPPTIKLTNVRHNNKLVLQGTADSRATVLAYVRSLEAEGYFTDIMLSVEENMNSIDFSIELKIGG